MDTTTPDAASPAELVVVDRIGKPPKPSEAAPATVLCLGLPEAARRRLIDSGDYVLIEDLDDPNLPARPDLVLVSTRLGRREAPTLVEQVRERMPSPVLALVHAGGEDVALELMRTGAFGAIAEGNEEAVRPIVLLGGHDTSLVEVHDRHYGRQRGRSDRAREREVVTGLPTAAAFARRLEELAGGDEVPRIALLQVLRLGQALRRLSSGAGDLLRRRIVTEFLQILAGIDVELFALPGGADFALVSRDLSPNAAQQLGRRLSRVVEVYAPTDGYPLALAMGHAGPEVTADPAAVHDLARRALEAATHEPDGAVIGADTLSLRVSASTELETALRLLDHVERQSGNRPGHGLRVAAVVVALLRAMGETRIGLNQARVAGHLHDIGKVGLPPEAMAGPDGLEGELLEAWRSHATLGERYLRVSAGDDVGAAVRHHHERWDGAGFPDGLAGADIPVIARAIALGNAWERCRAEAATPAEAFEALRTEAGAALDPDLVDLFAQAMEEVETEWAQLDSSVNTPGVSPSTSMM